MSKPQVLLLDEPSFGLAPVLVSEVFHLISELNQTGISILLVEQNAHRALQIAHRAVVLESGRIVLAGTPQQLTENAALARAYLGVDI
jgi:branched-chain amino acid transport system ATP-binding protein